MYSLKAAMKWDEDVFGLEYDLDLFNIVAVPDFNMGAMENKSLNIFNSKLVLASPETAPDADYAAILGVIGHEYFHNWTGNRLVLLFFLRFCYIRVQNLYTAKILFLHILLHFYALMH
ncbi:hypothetical protein AQUCO_05900019v1 [Aquilegia coerulea]|uniref:Peptidase M1 membrane alanine aminopeptidase domain-containing protein n=1 Tax=Aquilegia coerulea TaxID=218851 RepID=A0A2G5CF96_AQUCA|nr:hypothetical protein AQUCO_05900019v1 [Aquilegia coerulea]